MTSVRTTPHKSDLSSWMSLFVAIPRRLRLGAIFAMLTLAACGIYAMPKTWMNTSGDLDWFNDNNWDPIGAPGAGDQVTIPAGTTCLVYQAAGVDTLAVESGGKLIATNWNTKLTANAMMIAGTVQQTGPVTNLADMSRIWLAATNFFLAGTGKLDADGRGYNVTNMISYGPGAGIPDNSRGAGGSYGGRGGNSPYAGVSGTNYGSVDQPSDPGSAGAYGHSSYVYGGGAGGGAIRIDAGHATLNGTVSANGAVGRDYGGGGSGGSVWLTCETLAATGGVIQANGGRPNASDSGHGGGGRIAIHCAGPDTNLQLRCYAFPGIGAGLPGTEQGTYGQMGTLYLSDVSLINLNLGLCSGVRLVLPGITNHWITPAPLTIPSNTLVVLSESNFTFEAAGDVTVAKGAKVWIGSTGFDTEPVYSGNPGVTNEIRMIVGGSFWNEGTVTLAGLTNARPVYMDVDGALTLTSGARLVVFAGPTNDWRSLVDGGGRITVLGDTLLSGNSWIWVYTHQTSGSTIVFDLTNLTVAAGSGFDANEKGYPWFSSVLQYAPTNLAGVTVGNAVSGAGHGGKGGVGYQAPSTVAAAGGTNDFALAPIWAGAPGGYGHPDSPARAGGGALRIHAAAVRLDGTLTANAGGTPIGGYYGGGSAGGSIWLTCTEFSGSGLLQANGGSGGPGATGPRGTGGGGGGCVAVGIGLTESDKTALLSGTDPGGLIKTLTYAGWTGSNKVNPGLCNSYVVAPYNDTPYKAETGTVWYVVQPGDTFSLTISGDPVQPGTPSPAYGLTAMISSGSVVTASAPESVSTSPEGTRWHCTGYTLTTTDAVTVAEGPEISVPITMMQDLVLTWHWMLQYQFVLQAGLGGTVNAGDYAVWNDAGGSLTGIQATASGGYAFNLWNGDVPLTNRYDTKIDLQVDQPRTVKAIFYNTTPQTRTWTNGAGDGDWFNDDNWNPAGVPGPADQVLINSGTCVLDEETKVYSLDLGAAGVLIQSNAVSRLTANAMTIAGAVQQAGPVTNAADMSRIWLAATNFFLAGTGKLDADGRGFDVTNQISYGPGAGTPDNSRGAGGSYGGKGGNSPYGGLSGTNYGSAAEPSDLGSAGTYGHISCIYGGGAGGGAIRIEAGQAVLNGTVSANGALGRDFGGGGSGGSVWLTCDTLAATGGVIQANGGRPNVSNSGHGGGGRIAIHCAGPDTNLQLRCYAYPGIGAGMPGTEQGTYGQMGTLYLSDVSLLNVSLRLCSGVRLVLPAITNHWIAPSPLIIPSNALAVLSESNFTFEAAGDVTVAKGAKVWIGSAGFITEPVSPGSTDGTGEIRMEVGGAFRNEGTVTLGGLNQNCPAFLDVGGTLTLTNGARLIVFAGPTNETRDLLDGGSRVQVQGDTVLAGNSWIWPYAHQVCGSTVRFNLADLTVADGSGIDADGKGYAWFPGVLTYAPTGTLGKTGAQQAGGSGHGGRGGNGTSSPTSAGGATNGYAIAPLLPGAPGGYGHQDSPGRAGGGAILLVAQDVYLNGTLSANGAVGSTYGGGSAGGSIWVSASRFTGGATGLLRANGGDAGNSTWYQLGGGGGGRIAVAQGMNEAIMRELATSGESPKAQETAPFAAFLGQTQVVAGQQGSQSTEPPGEAGSVTWVHGFGKGRGSLFSLQ